MVLFVNTLERQGTECAHVIMVVAIAANRLELLFLVISTVTIYYDLVKCKKWTAAHKATH